MVVARRDSLESCRIQHPKTSLVLRLIHSRLFFFNLMNINVWIWQALHKMLWNHLSWSYNKQQNDQYMFQIKFSTSPSMNICPNSHLFSSPGNHTHQLMNGRNYIKSCKRCFRDPSAWHGKDVVVNGHSKRGSGKGEIWTWNLGCFSQAVIPPNPPGSDVIILFIGS